MLLLKLFGNKIPAVEVVFELEIESSAKEQFLLEVYIHLPKHNKEINGKYVNIQPSTGLPSIKSY